MSSALRGKTILLINIGSRKKEFILRKMKELGLRIVALHTEAETWAQPYIDRWIFAEPEDTDEQIIQKLRNDWKRSPDQRPDGAITFWEEEVPLLAQICKEFGFVGNSPETAQNTRSKFAMHEMLHQGGCNAVRQHLLRSKEDLATAIGAVGFPAIMKPLFGSDSLYVVYVRTPSEAYQMYDYLRANYTKHPYELLYKYEQGLFVFQEYVDGTECSVECFSQHGVPHVIGMQEKTNMQLPFFMETGDHIPSRMPASHRRAIEEEARAVLVALGVRNSLAHVEIKFSSKGPQVIEVASRMGGDYTWDVMHRVHGFDLIKAGCEIALGSPVTDGPMPPQSCILGKYLIPDHSGRIARMRGTEKFEHHPQVVEYHLSKQEGDIIAVPPMGYESAGWVLAEGKTHADAERALEDILAGVEFDVAPLPIRNPMTVLPKSAHHS